MKNNLGLIAHCEKALSQKWFYGWGSYGQKASKKLVDDLVSRYPAMNTKWRSYMMKAVENNTNLCDCYGLVKGYLFTSENGAMIYNSKYDINTAGAYSKSKEKGLLSTMPEIPGLILYMIGHVGIYIGNGRFIECSGGGVGMMEGRISNGRIIKGSKFTHWLKDANISYLEIEKPIIAPEIEKEKEPDQLLVKNLSVILDNEETEIKSVVINDINFVQLREIGDKLGYIVEYDPYEKVPVLTKKN